MKLASKLWILFFLGWMVLLTGALPFGPPGFLQAYRLRMFLSERTQNIAEVRSKVTALEETLVSLQSDKNIQEREIRKVLGYAGPDELVFDFTDPERL